MHEATTEQRRMAEEEDTLCITALEADGCELITLTDAERAEFIDATGREVALL